MLTQSHGRLCLAVALCFATLVLFLTLNHTNVFLSGRIAASPIANETLGFEKIFIINAPWRTDRKDSMSLTASHGGLDIEWIDGVDAANIKDKAYPPGNHRQVNQGARGCWRAHMDSMREVVAQNLSTALILEDDADWDVRIRSQLERFSHAARTIPDLTSQAASNAESQPRASLDRPNPLDLAKSSSINVPPPSSKSVPPNDPYGRDWDILWLGHCGASLPQPVPSTPDRLMQLSDLTVPSPSHLRPRPAAPPDALATLYPPHTRLYHRTANSTLCLHAYAVSQRGARKLLYHFGVKDFSQGYDFALSDYCGGSMRGATGEKRPMCVTVQPPLFSQYWGEGGGSDITGTGSGGRLVGSRYIRWSVRASLEALARGNGKEGVGDQWPDEEGAES